METTQKDILPSYYQVTLTLGVGAYGQVFKATDTRTGRKVAIKVIKLRIETELMATKHAIMIARELYILSKLSKLRANIYTISLLDAFANPEAYFDPSKLETVFLVSNVE